MRVREGIDLVVPHGRLEGKGVQEHHRVTVAPVDDQDLLTWHLEQRH